MEWHLGVAKSDHILTHLAQDSVDNKYLFSYKLKTFTHPKTGGTIFLKFSLAYQRNENFNETEHSWLHILFY